MSHTRVSGYKSKKKCAVFIQLHKDDEAPDSVLELVMSIALTACHQYVTMPFRSVHITEFAYLWPQNPGPRKQHPGINKIS